MTSLFLLALLVLQPVASAQPPLTPSAPPQMSRRFPTDTNPCHRTFIYRGKIIGCDSNLALDGEHLRPIIQDVPAAVSELNTYQSNRRSVNTLAYVGTIGLVLGVASLFVARSVSGSAANAVRTTGYLSTIVLTGGSLIYGISVLTTNEQHLGEAVRLYNVAKPNDPIELQFTTGINF